jgi:hypothetical protein
MYASVLYHKHWLHSIMHASNLLRVMALFCDSPVVEISGSVKTIMYADDREGVVGGHGNMSRLTGIPAHIAILNRMDKLESSLLSEGFANLSIKIDSTGRGSEEYHANLLKLFFLVWGPSKLHDNNMYEI